MSAFRRIELLLLPAALVFLLLLVGPAAFLIRLSLLPSVPSAPLTGPFSLSSYAELGDPYVVSIMVRTVRIASLTTVACLVLGYPVALSLARASGLWRSLQLVMVVAPLFVSVVVRAYGWILLLGRQGLVNDALIGLGVLDEPVQLLNTEGAVVVGMVEALLPFTVLSISAVLQRLDPALEEAARGLGATPLGAFVRVTLPLSLPGAAAGGLLVFMVSMGSYATPALLGGSGVRVMVTEIYTQVTAVFNWPLAAALSVLLLLVSLIVALAAGRLLAVSQRWRTT